MESFELFACGVGLAVHSRFGFFRDGAPTAICGMVLPRAGEVLLACRHRLGCAHGGRIRGLRSREHRRVWIPGLGRGCGKRIDGRGAFFAGVERHGFQLEKGELAQSATPPVTV